ncbi:hypothetical protein BLNAU_12141 [Blattamonas nauphoetae]|uniref:SPRY domain-containing protein n=1 Tax=Blattamonas nauphoetae TaxID=2049346 RepID=A0ABQ9XP36_9EUKA|nr:hypothetical protein BLNAU_12141 [Blattamonas nauphoetae]
MHRLTNIPKDDGRIEYATPPHIPRPHPRIPALLLTNSQHFKIVNTVVTRTSIGKNSRKEAGLSTILIGDAISSGIASMTVTILHLPPKQENVNPIHFGLIDSSLPVPKLNESLGFDVRNSLCLYSGNGFLGSLTISSDYIIQEELCHRPLQEGDNVRMEVNMRSAVRTVQFFVNGERGLCYMSEIPFSIRVGFSVEGEGTSFRLDRFIKQQRNTPLYKEMTKMKWKG